ncbi:hypothetical protein SAY86_012432 [Trapa natans]|uniref:Uncharacterized protein n=1 Tax=Trapa natans TaxID=22666 RepID=A0AAN7MCN8_TRANT|nr:hypothetical protein SAY86_012432 [Trapa natans]
MCSRCFPEVIDLYLDNIKLLNMRIQGRMILCGMISRYNLKQPQVIHNLVKILSGRNVGMQLVGRTISSS